MRRIILPLAATCALTAISIATAHSHAWLEEGEAAPGSLVATLKLPHAPHYPVQAVTMVAANTSAQHSGDAAPVKVGDLEITGAWARAMLPGQPIGGAYLTIANTGNAADKLVGVSSPDAAKVEVHTMSMKDNVMVMRPVEGGLEIPAGQTVELKPGGYHMMFMGVKEAFTEGASVPVTLEFEKAGKVELKLPVKSAAGGEDHSAH